MAKFRNAGQVCISPTRFYVQDKIYRRYLDRFFGCAKALKLGDGLEADTKMGPLANSRGLEAMEGLVQDCKQAGARVETGGKRHGNQGYFFEPTVVSEMPDSSKLMTVEPFVPIAPMVPFKTFDEVVARANALPYGLAAYAFTDSNKTATAIGDALECGMVGINGLPSRRPRRHSAASRKAATATKVASRAWKRIW